VKVCMCWY